MESSTSSDVSLIDAYSRKWDRALVALSIPHGAAFGAFLGQFDFSKKSSSPIYLLSFFGLLIVIIGTSVWLYYLSDLLRNVFLRCGHFSKKETIKSSVLFLILSLYPIAVLTIPMYFEQYPEFRPFALIGLILLTWGFGAVYVSNSIYLQIAKSMGVHLGD